MGSLRAQIWGYFILFASVILMLLWLFQIVFMQSYYQRMKTNSILNAANKIAREYDGSQDYSDTLDTMAESYDMNIVIVTLRDQILYDSERSGGGLIQQYAKIAALDQFRDAVLASEDGYYYTHIVDTRGNQMLLLAMYLSTRDNDMAMVYLYTALDPVGPTIDILKNQFTYITCIVLVLAFLLSFFIARMIARPITKLTKSAAKLARGDYTPVFEHGGYEEVNQLADTLNYATQEISKVDSLRRDLIANTSHDLRTPLTMVKAYAEMIRDLSGDNPEKRRKHLDVIISESDRLSLLVSDMLDLSKLEAGIMQVTKAECDLSALMTDIAARYQALSDVQDYNISLFIQPGLTVEADKARLEQAICNLINNALNYTGDDKRVILRLFRQEGRKGAAAARVEVSDTGEGIPADQIPLIWDRYYRVNGAHKRALVGTGLGLYIVRNILEAHGFAYGVLSTVGEGSTFWLEAPLSPGARAGKRGDNPPDPPGGSQPVRGEDET